MAPGREARCQLGLRPCQFHAGWMLAGGQCKPLLCMEMGVPKILEGALALQGIPTPPLLPTCVLNWILSPQNPECNGRNQVNLKITSEG